MSLFDFIFFSRLLKITTGKVIYR